MHTHSHTRGRGRAREGKRRGGICVAGRGSHRGEWSNGEVVAPYGPPYDGDWPWQVGGAWPLRRDDPWGRGSFDSQTASRGGRLTGDLGIVARGPTAHQALDLSEGPFRSPAPTWLEEVMQVSELCDPVCGLGAAEKNINLEIQRAGCLSTRVNVGRSL